MKLHNFCAGLVVVACSLATAQAAEPQRGTATDVPHPLCQAAFDRLDDLVSNPARKPTETTQQQLASGVEACRTARNDAAAERLEQILVQISSAVR